METDLELEATENAPGDLVVDSRWLPVGVLILVGRETDGQTCDQRLFLAGGRGAQQQECSEAKQAVDKATNKTGSSGHPADSFEIEHRFVGRESFQGDGPPGAGRSEGRRLPS